MLKGLSIFDTRTCVMRPLGVLPDYTGSNVLTQANVSNIDKAFQHASSCYVDTDIFLHSCPNVHGEKSLRQYMSRILRTYKNDIKNQKGYKTKIKVDLQTPAR